MLLTSSIVLCTYNGARFLEAQWRTLLAQTRPPDEIVVRDDASSDATPALLKDLAVAAGARGVRVHVIPNPRNLGYVRNFEAALRDATGDVLFLCDQDDEWHPEKIATLLDAFERRVDLLLACTDARRVDAAGDPLPRSLFEVLAVTARERQRIHAGDGFGVLLRRSLATGATIALRRSLLRDALPIAPGWVHDEWLAIIAAARGGFDSIEVPLIDYRQHAGNEIGMPDRGLAAKWHDLRRPRAASLRWFTVRAEGLLARLLELPAQTANARYPEQVRDRLAHLRVRSSIHGWPWMRFRGIVGESLNRRYQRHGTGWRSALRDLIRKG